MFVGDDSDTILFGFLLLLLLLRLLLHRLRRHGEE
jgi:MYXO-CTERM domain-containing protein